MMASIKGMQLLKLPELVKENAPPNASSNSAILKAPSAKPFQLLSAQIKPPNDMSPKLIIIPGVSKTTPHSIPLLKMPQNTISTSSQHPNREHCFHARLYHFPLLKKPAVKEQISLVEIPVRDDRALEIPQLIQIPVKQVNDIISTGSKHLKEHHTKLNLPYNVIQSRVREPSNIEIDASQNMGRMPGSKPLKRKRRRKRPVVSVKNNVSLSSSKQLENFASRKESCVSQSTQTTTDEPKRTKNRRKKMNLMALLEEAALFDASSASSGEEDLALKMLKNKSFLVKGDPYKESRDGQSLCRGIPQTSLEELLLRNFDEGPGNVQVTPPRYPLKDKRDSIMLEKRRKTESSTQTISDVNIPKCLVIDKPKTSAGLSWKEMILLSQGTSTNDPSQSSAASLKEIGVQVSESVPAIDKIEQTSQTDFTSDNDVVSTLLENLKNQGAFKEEHLTDGKKNGRELDLAQQQRYPWQYIADTDFSDVAMAQEKLMKSVKSQRPDLVERKWQEESMSRDLDHHKTASPTNSKNAIYDSSIIVQSRPVHAPPEIFLGMKVKDECIELSSIDGAEASRPINIVEISRRSSPIMIVNEVVENVMIRDIPLEMLQESFDVGKEIDINKAYVQKETVETRSDGHQIPESLVVKDTISEEKEHVVLKSKFINDKAFLAFKDRTSEVAAQASKLNSILAVGPKDRMHSNLKNMSVQLDALDELYEHLQKELKDSAMLMQTVDTLHHGFLEEPSLAKSLSA
ncbi:uncharacterized protein LOC135694626 [Rhopilema esculentum]|uniref:uncharacterized protein LOC135694626 n=1 Tax=Rhopilema esculentum TaxID=499914 RepID=UPI0031DB72A5